MEELIIKYLNGEADTREKNEVEEWRDADPENQKQFFEIQRVWEGSSRIQGLTNEDVDREWQFFLQNVRKRGEGSSRKRTARQYPLFWKIAAAIAVFAVAAYALIYFQNSPSTYNAEQNIEEVVLDDGTKVTLNKYSTLVVSSGFGEKVRSVRLDGEAFFEVTENPQSPFIVQSEYGELEVLGTSFNVLNDETNRSMSVTVSSGKVEIRQSDGSASKKLTPGMKGVVYSNRGIDVDLASSDNYLAWKTGKMDFENESLKEILSVLKSVYQIQIELEDPNIASCTLTAQFEDAEIDEVLKVISGTLDLEYKKEESKVVFSGQGC